MSLILDPYSSDYGNLQLFMEDCHLVQTNRYEFHQRDRDADATAGQQDQDVYFAVSQTQQVVPWKETRQCRTSLLCHQVIIHLASIGFTLIQYWQTDVSGLLQLNANQILHCQIVVKYVMQIIFTISIPFAYIYVHVMADRSCLPDSSSGVSSRMWVRIPAMTLVSLSKTLNHNCFSPPRG